MSKKTLSVRRQNDLAACPDPDLPLIDLTTFGTRPQSSFSALNVVCLEPGSLPIIEPPPTSEPEPLNKKQSLGN